MIGLGSDKKGKFCGKGVSLVKSIEVMVLQKKSPIENEAWEESEGNVANVGKEAEPGDGNCVRREENSDGHCVVGDAHLFSTLF